MHYVAVFVDEDDVAAYTIKTIDDPRTLNKTVYIRPLENILSQGQIIEMWENLTGKELDKSIISAEDFLASMKGNDQEITPLMSKNEPIQITFFTMPNICSLFHW